MTRFGALFARFERFDRTVDAWFDPLRDDHRLHTIAHYASELADHSMAWHLASVSRALVQPSFEPKVLRLAIALGAESALVNGVMKPLIGRPRPEGWEEVAPDVRRPRTASFPSGHSSSAAMNAMVMTAAPPPLKPLWWGVTGLVAASRIHNRMHHPSDVVVGLVIGVGLGRVARRFVG